MNEKAETAQTSLMGMMGMSYLQCRPDKKLERNSDVDTWSFEAPNPLFI